MFFGLAFRLGGLGAAVMGGLADVYGIGLKDSVKPAHFLNAQNW